MNKIFRIVWNEAAQAWVAVSELTKKHKKRASVTAVAATLVAGMLSPFAQASNTDSDVAKNLQPSELETDYYFRVTTANTGEPDDLEHYAGCPNGNADSACPDTEMNIGVLDKDSAPTEDNSDNSRLVLEGNKGIRLKKAENKSHKITFDAPVKAADGSGAISIDQPVEGDNAGHTIIKSEIKSGSPDKIQVESANGETTITWVGGDTAGGGAGGGTPVTAGDGISVSADNKVSVNAKTDGGIKVDGDGVSVNAKTDGGIKVDGDGVSVNAKTNGGLTVDGSGVSVNTDGTTITVDTATGNVKAVTGGFKLNTTTGATEANDNDGNKLATVTNVANAINAAKVKVAAGNGAKVEHNEATNTYTVSADLPFTKDAKDKSITLNEEGVIHNVANGRVAKDSKDAVNGGQLHAVESRLSGNMDKLNHRIDKVGKRADAGTASAIATANLLQSYRPGLSAATAAVGQYRGQSAVAVGYSRLSDNGKYGVKFSLGANTQGNVGAGAGVAYFW